MCWWRLCGKLTCQIANIIDCIPKMCILLKCILEHNYTPLLLFTFFQCSDECKKEAQGVNAICRDGSGNLINKLNCSSLAEKDNYIWIKSNWTKVSWPVNFSYNTQSFFCLLYTVLPAGTVENCYYIA